MPVVLVYILSCVILFVPLVESDYMEKGGLDNLSVGTLLIIILFIPLLILLLPVIIVTKTLEYKPFKRKKND